MRISNGMNLATLIDHRQNQANSDVPAQDRAERPQATMNQFTGGNRMYQSRPTVISEDGTQYTTTDPNESVIVYADDVSINVKESRENPDELVNIYASGQDNAINGSDGEEHVTIGGGAGNLVFTHGGDDRIETFSTGSVFVNAGAGRDVIEVSGNEGRWGIRTIVGGADSDVLTARNTVTVVMFGDNGNGVNFPEEGQNFEGVLNPVRDGNDTFNVENSQSVSMAGQGGNDTFNIDKDSRRWRVDGGGRVGVGSVDEEFVDTVNLDFPYDDSIVHEMQYLIVNQMATPNQKLVIRDDEGLVGSVVQAERINYSNGVSFEFTGDDWVQVE